jgi:hypothetical protein
MARYRVGDKYLSEQEYEDHIDGNWAFWLFIIGAIGGGYSANYGLSHFGINGLEKWQLFSIIVSASIVSGYLLSKLRNLIQISLCLMLVCLVIGVIGRIIWDSL